MEKRVRGMIPNGFPVELWWDILSLLPVKTLLVVRSVCKWFVGVIDDSEFLSFHLRHFPKNVGATRHLTYQPDSDSSSNILYCGSLDEEESERGFTEIDRAIMATEVESGIRVTSSLDGLFVISSSCFECVYGGLTMADTNSAYLWNPSLKKIRLLSLPHPKLIKFSIGYDSFSRDYKIVGISSQAAWLYSVKSGTWTDLLPSGSGDFRADDLIMYGQSYSIKDGVIWSSICLQNNNGMRWFKWKLDLFDLRSETFRSVDPPFDLLEGCVVARLLALDGGSTVGMLSVNADNQGSIVTLDTKTMSWIRRYNIPPDLFSFLNREDVNPISLEERNGELVSKYQVLSHRKSIHFLTYNLKTQTHTIINKTLPGFTGGSINVYIESLLSV